ncbi:recombinase family protein [Porcipelethomonas sp.]|uniref:recombinase family protein n=1 Tax=Porcipelethomonas sp. TaxID=2981675 RepID=UPI003EF5EA97
MNGQYAIYLRKSRADADAEARGEGETLSRHRAKLLELAKKKNLTIAKIHEEIVSGDTIESRPEMQKLLDEVNAGMWDGVLCMEIERLARGDSIDQGIVSRAFKYSNTKIITPVKVYDPSNEFDEEYFEFSLFMSRREYKTINRRMQAGRLASVKEGNYIGSQPPYGYKKVHNYEQKNYTLEQIPEEAEAVKLMYELYTQKDMGYSKIATFLNNMGIKPKRIDTWSHATVKAIIENPLYCGKIRWNWRKTKKIIKDGEIKYTNPINPDAEIYKGLHEPIVSEEVWKLAESIRNKNKHTSTHNNKTLKNQFAGLMYCELCGRAMVRRPYSNGLVYMMCIHNGCKCVSSNMADIDDAVYNAIVRTYRQSVSPSENDKRKDKTNSLKDAESKIKSELQKLKIQQNKLYDLLEQGIYTTEIFVERSAVISDKIASAESQIKKLQDEARPQAPTEETIIRLKHVIDAYQQCMDANEKNKMLKSIIRKIQYKKTTKCNNENNNFEIKIDFIF